MTVTVTPEPAATPPRVRLDFDTDNAAAIFTALQVSRNGAPIRAQPPVGDSLSVVYDYEAPFEVPLVYDVEGQYLPPTVADWTETWSSLAAWTGATASYAVAGGKASSSIAAAAIVRSASNTIQRVAVATPVNIRVELIDVTNVVVASVQVDTKVTLVGKTTVQTSGSGDFVISLSNGIVTVTSTSSSWSLSRPYTGAPIKVRLVALGVAYVAGQVFATSTPSGVDVDSSGNVYAASLTGGVLKYGPTGTLLTTFAGINAPYGLALDASGNIYASDGTTIRRFNASGTQTLSFSSANCGSIDVDASGNIYVCDRNNSFVRKYNSSGTLQLTVTVPLYGSPTDVVVDASGNIFVADAQNNLIRKFNTSGTQTASFTAPTQYVAIDTAGNLYVTGFDDNSVRKYDPTGVLLRTFSSQGNGAPSEIALDSTGNVYVADYQTNKVRKFVATPSSVGTIATTPIALEQRFADSEATQLDVGEAWLIHPTQPGLSVSVDGGPDRNGLDLVNVTSQSGETKSSDAERTIHTIVGRRRPVIITTGPRPADEWLLQLGAQTVAAKNTIRDLVDDQTPLLFRSPPSFGWDLPDDWYSVGDVTISRIENPVITERTISNLPLTPVDEPIVSIGVAWSYGSTLLAAPTYADRLTLFPTYLDALAGQL